MQILEQSSVRGTNLFSATVYLNPHDRCSNAIMAHAIHLLLIEVGEVEHEHVYVKVERTLLPYAVKGVKYILLPVKCSP